MRRVPRSLLGDVDRELAADLNRIEYGGTSIVTLGYRREQIRHPLDGFGFVVPAIEKRPILAGSFSSVKFAGRAPAGAVLIRVFVGSVSQPKLSDADDTELLRIATTELRSLLGIDGEPMLVEIVRWQCAMPQYHVGHGALVDRIENAAAKWPGLTLAGNAYHGVGIPQCIHSGESAAERLLSELTKGRGRRAETAGQ